MTRRLSDQSKRFEKDAKKDNREEIRLKLKALEAKKWLYGQRNNIEDYIKRIKKLDIIEKAKKSTNTKVLSEKKGEFAQRLITDAFIDRFRSELDKLGASKIKVELVKTKVTKGQVLHKLKLQGEIQNSIGDILSEGEKRIISIAAFLADTTASDKQVPLIFDDPISSLDQSYEEAVVKRLIELSNKRQIIIFTHRLSFLGLLRHSSEDASKKINIQSIRVTNNGTGEPAPVPISQDDIKKSLNKLIFERFSEAKKAEEAGNYELAESILKSVCSDFRIIIERSVEKDLLCDIVERYRPPVHTQHIKKLKKLTNHDCTLLDDLMAKYSKFEHSQSTETPVELPKLDTLLDDMNKLKTWREEYKNRKMV
ncbi:MAG: AAA family ATPase [Candidatus Marinimicrobia bacterium]|nr:AAA family ATPase [Candidatus Neomarinimicrobiota bacterium]